MSEEESKTIALTWDQVKPSTPSNLHLTVFKFLERERLARIVGISCLVNISTTFLLRLASLYYIFTQLTN